jgi:superfamily II DNA or RNA helicase
MGSGKHEHEEESLMSVQPIAAVSMTLVQALLNVLPEQVVHRGLGYALDRERADDVTIEGTPRAAGDTLSMDGWVRGNERYRVKLRVHSSGGVETSCTCPFFIDRQQPCKHIVALLIEASARGYWTPHPQLRIAAFGALNSKLPIRSPAQSQTRGRGAGPGSPDGKMGRGGRQLRGGGGQREFIEGEEWRSTLVRPIHGSPPPLVYAFAMQHSRQPSAMVDVFKRHYGHKGHIRLSRVDMETVLGEGLKLDATDKAIIDEIRRGDELAKSRTWLRPEDDPIVPLVKAIASAGRLHARLDRMRLGPAYRWDGDVGWTAEVHVEPIPPEPPRSERFSRGRRRRRDRRRLHSNNPPPQQRFGETPVAPEVPVDRPHSEQDRTAEHRGARQVEASLPEQARPIAPPTKKLSGNASWLEMLADELEPLPETPVVGAETGEKRDEHSDAELEGRGVERHDEELFDRDERDGDGSEEGAAESYGDEDQADERAEDRGGEQGEDELGEDRDRNEASSRHDGQSNGNAAAADPNPLARGMRIFVKLIAEGRNPVSCMRPLRAQVGSLLFVDRLIVRPKPGPSGSTRGSFGWSRDALLRDGVRTVSTDEIRSVLDGIRHGDYQPEAPEGASGALVIDPRIGLTFFRAAPEPVVRLDSGGKRVTVDVQPLARYRDPDPAPNGEEVIVDRDAREHKIIDSGEFAMHVPYPMRSREAALNRDIERLVRDSHGSGDAQLRIPRHALPKFIAAAGKAGVAVEMAKAPARLGGSWSVQIKSGTDWFELTGELVTPEGTIPLRELVEAAKRQPDAIEVLTLADGTSVVVPARLRAVLKRLSALLASRDKSEGLRFGRAEALLLDEALEGAEVRSEDDAFIDLRSRLQKFDRAEPREPTATFRGTLRDYQKAGLGWFEALRGLEFGGCLADEMGLGKTIQVLAMLLHRKAELAGDKSRACSIIVVPRSLVRNWIDEASRFAPSLRVIDLSHGKRTLDAKTFASCDVALMTYGTILRDVETLSKRTFDYVILDEAQAIKNADARTSKAAKQLKANHRLALTGTPIENHLGELWSLMEFLNQGATSRFEGLAGRGDPDDLGMVRRAVQPFILRRTKREVAKELPERIEQTLPCEMTEEQEKHYNQLLAKIRSDLLDQVERIGIGKARMAILEGLLRLRQISCHPVLVDRARFDAGSGKLEALLPMLEESHEEGRKTLVFSQFTSFLALVRAELDDRKIPYEYLDGGTTDRAERVKHFAEDEGCSVFLLSLKAGGVGLNLQAAERVVLLDPWWNPAVEAQAIDRAHRIGQHRTVHALRFVSVGTVEERVLEMQARKRTLADAILGEDAGPLGSLTREDLEFLLRPVSANPVKDVTDAQAAERAATKAASKATSTAGSRAGQRVDMREDKIAPSDPAAESNPAEAGRGFVGSALDQDDDGDPVPAPAGKARAKSSLSMASLTPVVSARSAPATEAPSMSAPLVTPTLTSKTAAPMASKATLKPTLKPTPKPASKPAPTAISKPTSKPAAKVAAKPAPKLLKSSAKPITKSTATGASKATVKKAAPAVVKKKVAAAPVKASPKVVKKTLKKVAPKASAKSAAKSVKRR